MRQGIELQVEFLAGGRDPGITDFLTIMRTLGMQETNAPHRHEIHDKAGGSSRIKDLFLSQFEKPESSIPPAAKSITA